MERGWHTRLLGWRYAPHTQTCTRTRIHSRASLSSSFAVLMYNAPQRTLPLPPTAAHVSPCTAPRLAFFLPVKSASEALDGYSHALIVCVLVWRGSSRCYRASLWFCSSFSVGLLRACLSFSLTFTCSLHACFWTGRDWLMVTWLVAAGWRYSATQRGAYVPRERCRAWDIRPSQALAGHRHGHDRGTRYTHHGPCRCPGPPQDMWLHLSAPLISTHVHTTPLLRPYTVACYCFCACACACDAGKWDGGPLLGRGLHPC